MTGFIHAWYEPHHGVSDNTTAHTDIHKVIICIFHLFISPKNVDKEESRLEILVTPYSFLYAEYAAATVLVTFCVLLGKVSEFY